MARGRVTRGPMMRTRSPRFFHVLCAPVALGLPLLAACSGNEPSDVPTARAPTAVVAAVLTRGPDDTFQTYLVASEHAPAGKLDLSQALELPDALVTQNDEAIIVGDNERITLQRYEVNADYSFTLTGELSLQGYGVDYINNPPLFFSPERAFYVDAPRGQIIVFNPTSMEITGDIQVPELLREDYVVWLGPAQRLPDGRFIATVLYTDEEWTATAPDSTVGIVVEDDLDQPIQLIRDDRGVGAYLSFTDPRGDFYFAADGLSGDLALAGFQEVPSSRVLRVRAGEERVDADYLLDLGELLNTPATSGFWPVSGTKFVVQAWASDVNPRDVLEEGEGGFNQPYYDWQLVDAATGTATLVQGLERSAGNDTIRLALDGETYLQRWKSSGESAELYLLRDDARAEKVAETDNGGFWFLGRVRSQAEMAP